MPDAEFFIALFQTLAQVSDSSQKPPLRRLSEESRGKMSYKWPVSLKSSWMKMKAVFHQIAYRSC